MSNGPLPCRFGPSPWAFVPETSRRAHTPKRSIATNSAGVSCCFRSASSRFPQARPGRGVHRGTALECGADVPCRKVAHRGVAGRVRSSGRQVMRGMFGLRVRMPGRAPVTMALDQSDYHVGAEATWRRTRHRRLARKPRLSFSGTGLDDQSDLLRWFSFEPSASGAWMEITVVETAIADPPRRQPRLKVDWDAAHQRRLKADCREIASLTRVLRRPDLRRPPAPVPPPPLWAEYGFVVSLDDQVIGSAGVAGHGEVSVQLVVKRKGRRARSRCTRTAANTSPTTRIAGAAGRCAATDADASSTSVSAFASRSASRASSTWVKSGRSSAIG